MKRTLMTAAAVGALGLGITACAALGMNPAEASEAPAVAPAAQAATAGPATAADAAAFVADAETRLAALSEEAARIQSRPGQRKAFLAVCWLMVEPPRIRPPRSLDFRARSMAFMSNPRWAQNVESSEAITAWTSRGEMSSSDRHR